MLLTTNNLTTIKNSIEALGAPVSALTWREALSQGRLDWTVSKLQHRSPIDGRPVPSWGIYRDDNSAFLGQVGAGYTPVQNDEQFAFADDLISTIRGARFVSAGAIGAGEKVFAVIELDTFEIGASGDVHKAMLVISDWKNSFGALRAQISLFRQVCSNGLHSWVQDSALKFIHTRNVKSRMIQAAGAASLISSSVDGLKLNLNTLAGREITKAETVSRVLDRLFPATEAELKETDPAKIANFARYEAQATVASLFADNDNNAFPSESRSAFALLNAYTRYTDHFVTPRSSSATVGQVDEVRRHNSALFGSGAERKAKALEIILEETATGSGVFERRPSVFLPAYRDAGLN